MQRAVDLDFTLTANQYAIFPTRLNLYTGGHGAAAVPPHLMLIIAVSDYENIQGRVIFRIRPLSRFGSIE